MYGCQIKSTVRNHYNSYNLKTKNNEKLKSTKIAGRNVKWYSRFGKQFDSFLRKYTYHKMQQVHPLSPKRNENVMFTQRCVCECSQKRYS